MLRWLWYLYAQMSRTQGDGGCGVRAFILLRFCIGADTRMRAASGAHGVTKDLQT
jgi:hypothetical protein